jgi:hypothetical protein
MRRRQDSNLRGQSPVDFGSTPLTAWVRLLLLVAGTGDKLPLVGLEPTIFGLGSQRLIH